MERQCCGCLTHLSHNYGARIAQATKSDRPTKSAVSFWPSCCFDWKSLFGFNFCRTATQQVADRQKAKQKKKKPKSKLKRERDEKAGSKTDLHSHRAEPRPSIAPQADPFWSCAGLVFSLFRATSEEQEHVVQLLVYSMAFALSGRVNYATVRRDATRCDAMRFEVRHRVQAKMLIK